MAEQEDVTTSGNRIFYSLFFILICVAIACYSLISVRSAGAVAGLRLVAFISYFLLGVVYANKLQKKLKWSFSFSVLLSLLILGSLFAFHFFFTKEHVYNAVGAAASFLLPSVILYSFTTFTSLPFSPQKIWYPDRDFIANKAIIFVNSIPIQFKLVTTTHGKSYGVFKTVAPSQMSLGKIFQAFLMQQANNNIYIEQKDERGKKVGWLFYAVVAHGIKLRPLDPDLTLWDNNVKRNTIIILQRVKSETLQLEYNSVENA